jgi:rubrerythrin
MTENSKRRWQCIECGYIHEGEEPPDVCPECFAPKSAFFEIENGK